ncbi:MAG: guanylate kinase [Faecalibacterium sp.]
MNNNEKYLFIVSGPAGVGKDSVVQAMRAQHPEIERSVTATTRAPRPGEVEGVNYYYYSVEAFEKLKAEGGVLESNFFCGNYYGTVRHDVDHRLAAAKPVVLVIDVNGAASIKQIYPGATTIFINPPSPEELEKRLRGRATESEEKILERLEKAWGELDAGAQYQEKIVNDTLEHAAEAVYAIICKYTNEG